MALRAGVRPARAYFRGIKMSPDLEGWAAYRETVGDRFEWNTKTVAGAGAFVFAFGAAYFHIKGEMVQNDMYKTGRDTRNHYWGPGTWPKSQEKFPTDARLNSWAKKVEEDIKSRRESEVGGN